SGPVLLAAFKTKKNLEDTEFFCAVIDAIASADVKSAATPLLDYLPPDANRYDPSVVRAAVLALGKFKEKRAVEPMIKILEVSPDDQPKNPGPNSPPASYWEGITKRWTVVARPIQRALREITGEDVPEGKPAHEWYKKNKARLGI